MSSSSLLVLSADDVDKVTATFSPTELSHLMARVFLLVSDGNVSKGQGIQTQIQAQRVYAPHRTSIPMRNYTALFMPARISETGNDLERAVGSDWDGGTTIKVVTVPRSSADTRGLAATTMVLDDDDTGSVKAILNARSLTALRNAAGSLLSTTLVGPRTPTSIVAFGAGKQIEVHLDLHLRYFSSITKCTIVNRSINARVDRLRRTLEHRFPSTRFTWLASTPSQQEQQQQENIKHALSSASIVICATSSTTPLFPSNWVRSGTHIILIGSYTPAMREVDNELVLRAALEPGAAAGLDGATKPTQILLVDSREACAVEAGELIQAGVSGNRLVEMGELVMKALSTNAEDGGGLVLGVDNHPDRKGEDVEEGPVTMFKSVGLGLQDVAIACAVVSKAERMEGVGTRIDGYDI
ncbi:hypothetical protein AMATHDRAFT_62769 [Amanita thiersii Skay4041]|uniref:Ornithine cyclodeaminase n=1 Tax=Amanita thiersii Skay4041 TaxID=703135 RepID=A0A2A9NJY9_9AGAR|nr:hypothetical protein AMATHDRAFT_62769 [Amanita thiersii Skay4041]